MITMQQQDEIIDDILAEMSKRQNYQFVLMTSGPYLREAMRKAMERCSEIQSQQLKTPYVGQRNKPTPHDVEAKRLEGDKSADTNSPVTKPLKSQIELGSSRCGDGPVNEEKKRGSNTDHQAEASEPLGAGRSSTNSGVESQLYGVTA